MLARAHFSHRECENKSGSDLQDMLHTKGINWNDSPTKFRRGRCVVRRDYTKDGAERHEWVVDNEIPVFTQDRDYIQKHVDIHKVAS